jgi:hypothetical protein
LSSSQDSPFCFNELAHFSKTLGKTWNNHTADNILTLISSRLWPTFIPYQPSFMLSTISNAISYCFQFTTTSSIALFKMGCFKSFTMANRWYARPSYVGVVQYNLQV